MQNNNFELCKYKSKDLYTRQVKICCNNYKDITAHDCPKREIFPLTPDHCNNCNIFTPKDN